MTLGIVFLALGLIYIYLEFFMPYSVMAMGGIILLFASFSVLFLQKINLWYFTSFVVLALFLLLSVIQIAFWRIKKGKIHFFLKNSSNFGYKIYNEQLVGRKAITVTDISPSGKIFIDGRYFSALSHTGEIKKGKEVEVIGGEETHLIITKINCNLESY